MSAPYPGSSQKKAPIIHATRFHRHFPDPAGDLLWRLDRSHRQGDWNRDRPDKPIDVHTYLPDTSDINIPLLFVIHGNARNAKEYCFAWVESAQKYNFLVICPELDAFLSELESCDCPSS